MRRGNLPRVEQCRARVSRAAWPEGLVGPSCGLVYIAGVILTRRPAQAPDGRLEAGTTEDHDAVDGSEGLVRRSEKSGWLLIFFP